MSKSYPRSQPIVVRLPPDVVEEIHNRKLIKSVRLFKSGGIGNWVRGLIYRELGLSLPPVAEDRNPAYELPLRDISAEGLTPAEELILRLGQRGRSLGQIARYLNDQEVPTSGSKKWVSAQIEKIINRILVSQFPIVDAPQK